jgi:8-oxo-dGTP diphosphatase
VQTLATKKAAATGGKMSAVKSGSKQAEAEPSVPRVSVMTDVVLFTFEDQQLKVLLVRRAHPPYEGLWAFPGGYLAEDEELEACAARELKEETGLTGARLKQAGAVGTLGRDPRGRSVSIIYFGAVSAEISRPVPSDEAVEVAFHPVKRRPRLAFDHEQILKQLLNLLKEEITRSEILFDFFRSVIPSADMLALIEQIWGTTADRRKWDGWMHSLPFLQEMSGGQRFRLDRTEMRRWLRTHPLNVGTLFNS